MDRWMDRWMAGALKVVERVKRSSAPTHHKKKICTLADKQHIETSIHLMFYSTVLVSYSIHLNNVFKFVRAKSYIICRLADKTLHHAVRATTVDDAIGVRKAQTLLTLGVGTDSVQRKR